MLFSKRFFYNQGPRYSASKCLLLDYIPNIIFGQELLVTDDLSDGDVFECLCLQYLASKFFGFIV